MGNLISIIGHSLSLFLIVINALFLLSCNNKNNAVYDLVMFRNEIKQHSSEYNEQDWQEAIDEYTEICDRLNKMEFTKEEILEIDKIKGEIAGYAATSACQEVSDRLSDMADEFSSFADGFNNVFELPKTNRK